MHLQPSESARPAEQKVADAEAVREAVYGSEVRFQAMSDASPLGIFVSDAAGECIYTNNAYQQISGLSFEQAQGTSWSRALHPDDRPRVMADWLAAARGGTDFKSETRFLRADGEIVWASLNAAVMREGGMFLGHVQIVEDISQRKAVEEVLRNAEEALFAEKERAQVTLNSIGDAVLTTNLDGNVVYLNRVAEQLTGWSALDACGRPLSEVFRVVNGTTHMPTLNPAQRAMNENRTVGLSMDSLLIRHDGSEKPIEDSSAPIHNRAGEVVGAVIVFHDVSESRTMALKMAHLAQHDALTGLPNRQLLSERLAQAIGQARRHGKQLAVLFLDLDFFKTINDSLGHLVGDHLLQSVAELLSSCVRATDTVCRQGGDEFVILLAEIAQPQDAAQIAEKLIEAFAEPHVIDGHELHVTLSIGVSIYPDDASNADAAMQNADTAMYYAKTRGRNNFQFYTAAMNTQAGQRLFVENGLRRALKQGEFVLHYQPKVDIATGRLCGAEALIRWQDPELGMVYPAEFVPIAEACGLIVPIGRWVLREACRQMQTWLVAGLPAVPVAVNVSAHEFRDPGFVAGLDEILKETGLAETYLELELTESLLMQDAQSSVSVLAAIKAMGVKLAVDDFGTGYSSLSYLSRFPTNTLKIDQSFVGGIAEDADSASIVSAVIALGRNLRLRVIAEGVETAAQLAFLRTEHCDEGQGFLFGYPVDAAAFSHLLAAAPRAAD